MAKISYSNLIRELAVTDFKLKYQGSVLGYLWSFAKPLMLFGVLYVVFTRVIKLGGNIPHYPVYLLLGIVMWTYFVDSTNTAMASIVDRADLIRKVYFPRAVIIVAASISALITLVLNLLVVGVFMLFLGIRPSSGIVLVPFLLIELFILCLGCSLLLAALYVKFRDVRHIWEVGLQMLFYATPIIYPVRGFIPDKFIPYALLNPIAQIIQDIRVILITPAAVTAGQTIHNPTLVIPYVLPFVVLAIGLWYFNSAAAKFAEEV